MARDPDMKCSCVTVVAVYTSHTACLCVTLVTGIFFYTVTFSRFFLKSWSADRLSSFNSHEVFETADRVQHRGHSC